MVCIPHNPTTIYLTHRFPHRRPHRARQYLLLSRAHPLLHTAGVMMRAYCYCYGRRALLGVLGVLGITQGFGLQVPSSVKLNSNNNNNRAALTSATTTAATTAIETPPVITTREDADSKDAGKKFNWNKQVRVAAAAVNSKQYHLAGWRARPWGVFCGSWEDGMHVARSVA